MPIEFRCSQCNQLLRVSDASAGKNARCPKCQTTLKVPGGAQPAAAPAPAPTPANDPFAFMGAGGGTAPAPQPDFGGFPSSPPPKPDPFGFPPAGGPPANPFGESKPAFGSGGMGTNPYASPAATASFSPTSMTTSTYGMRPGLPWESQGQSAGTWWETAKLCMMSPTYAFSIMRQGGGIGNPMMYSLVGQMIGAAAASFWQVVIGVAMIALTGGDGEAMGLLLAQIAGQVIYILVTSAIGATLGALIMSGILHLFLLMVGAGNKGYEATFRTIAFANGAIAWMQIIPILGPLAMFFWGLVIEVIGLARAHETDVGKVVLAFVLAIVAMMFLCALPFILLFIFLGAAMAGAGAGGGFGN